MRSNCLFWAQLEYRRRLRAWIRRGMPKGEEPYLLIRPSRLRPRWLPHFLVGDRDQDTGRMELDSYTPIEAVDVPWWHMAAKLLFRGRVVRGD